MGHLPVLDLDCTPAATEEGAASQTAHCEQVRALENAFTYLLQHKDFKSLNPKEQAKLLAHKATSI